MKRVFITAACMLALMLALAASLLAAGCEDEGSPASVVREFTYAQADEDCDRLVPLLDAQSRDILGKATGPRGDPAEGCRQAMEAQTQEITISDFKTIEETIEGDSATVKFSMTGMVNDQQMSEENVANLRMENGEWKVSLFTDTAQP